MGKVSVEAPLIPETVEKELQLYAVTTRPEGVQEADRKPGVITVEITTSDDLLRF